MFVNNRVRYNRVSLYFDLSFAGDVQQTQIRRHEEGVRVERVVRLRDRPHHLQLVEQVVPGEILRSDNYFLYHSSFIETRAILFLFSTYPYFPFALPRLPVNKTCKQSFCINCNTFAIVSSVINLSSLEQQVLLILHWNMWICQTLKTKKFGCKHILFFIIHYRFQKSSLFER